MSEAKNETKREPPAAQKKVAQAAGLDTQQLETLRGVVVDVFEGYRETLEAAVGLALQEKLEKRIAEERIRTTQKTHAIVQNEIASRIDPIETLVHEISKSLQSLQSGQTNIAQIPSLQAGVSLNQARIEEMRETQMQLQIRVAEAVVSIDQMRTQVISLVGSINGDNGLNVRIGILLDNFEHLQSEIKTSNDTRREFDRRVLTTMDTVDKWKAALQKIWAFLTSPRVVLAILTGVGTLLASNPEFQQTLQTLIEILGE